MIHGAICTQAFYLIKKNLSTAKHKFLIHFLLNLLSPYSFLSFFQLNNFPLTGLDFCQNQFSKQRFSLECNLTPSGNVFLQLLIWMIRKTVVNPLELIER